MKKLPNYLMSFRKRIHLSQSIVMYILGRNNKSAGSLSKWENKVPKFLSIKELMTLEIIYGHTPKEMFPLLWEEAENDSLKRISEILLQDSLSEIVEEKKI
jgi:transcriptional regulator with XRE-family HTH domain